MAKHAACLSLRRFVHVRTACVRASARLSLPRARRIRGRGLPAAPHVVPLRSGAQRRECDKNGADSRSHRRQQSLRARACGAPAARRRLGRHTREVASRSASPAGVLLGGAVCGGPQRALILVRRRRLAATCATAAASARGPSTSPTAAGATRATASRRIGTHVGRRGRLPRVALCAILR